MNSDADGIVIYPDGMILWNKPIGRDRPYTVNVTAASLAGESVISWNVEVSPTYTPIITKVESVGSTNKRLLKGIINYKNKVDKSVIHYKTDLHLIIQCDHICTVLCTGTLVCL